MSYYKQIWEHVDAPPEYIATEWLQPETARTFESGLGTWYAVGATIAQGTIGHTGVKSIYMTFGSNFNHGIEYAEYQVGTIEHNKIATFSYRQYFSTYTGYWIIQANNGATAYRYDSVNQNWSTSVFLYASSFFPTGTFDHWYLTVWYPNGGTNSRIFVDDVSFKT
jgi:hypothetical protein